MKPKVFGIGLSRTGTSSLNKALQILGWNAIHFPRDIVEIAEHEAATDITVTMRWELLRRLYPGAFFVYTDRNLNDWLKSCESHFEDFDCRQDLQGNPYSVAVAEAMWTVYGSWYFNDDRFVDAYIRHSSNVSNRMALSSQCVRMNICGGEGWEVLCPFLGVPIPDVPFPHENKHED